MSSSANFRKAIRSKALRQDLEAVFEKHGLQLLKDDGAWMFLDDYTDTAKIHIREKGWFEKWKQKSEFYRPVPEEKEK